MHFLMTHWVLLLCVFGATIFVLGMSAVIEGWLDGKNRVTKGPREEMFWCHIHGQFRKQHCLPLFPELEGRAVNSFVCPMCYKKAVFDDVDAKLKVR